MCITLVLLLYIIQCLPCFLWLQKLHKQYPSIFTFCFIFMIINLHIYWIFVTIVIFAKYYLLWILCEGKPCYINMHYLWYKHPSATVILCCPNQLFISPLLNLFVNIINLTLFFSLFLYLNYFVHVHVWNSDWSVYIILLNCIYQ